MISIALAIIIAGNSINYAIRKASPNYEICFPCAAIELILLIGFIVAVAYKI